MRLTKWILLSVLVCLFEMHAAERVVTYSVQQPHGRHVVVLSVEQPHQVAPTGTVAPEEPKAKHVITNELPNEERQKLEGRIKDLEFRAVKAEEAARTAEEKALKSAEGRIFQVQKLKDAEVKEIKAERDELAKKSGSVPYIKNVWFMIALGLALLDLIVLAFALIRSGTRMKERGERIRFGEDTTAI